MHLESFLPRRTSLPARCNPCFAASRPRSHATANRSNNPPRSNGQACICTIGTDDESDDDGARLLEHPRPRLTLTLVRPSSRPRTRVSGTLPSLLPPLDARMKYVRAYGGDGRCVCAIPNTRNHSGRPVRGAFAQTTHSRVFLSPPLSLSVPFPSSPLFPDVVGFACVPEG